MRIHLPLLTAVAVFAVSVAASQASPQNKGQPADTIHPNIHNKVGQKSAGGANANANPNGSNANGGQIHGIANNPGQSGTNPNDDGVPGFANQLDNVHGGIDEWNENHPSAP